ncbi:hypothetical protein [Ottowia sp.]|uniref:hypothetical protein n=1 Tax=Ottowia sp. TaxID=1898956 RepID=UPI0025EF1A47|nr:hypothetical protein [Ottowia sp.]
MAGRDKDDPFVATMLRHGIISVDTLVARIAVLPLDEARKARLQRQARRLAQA